MDQFPLQWEGKTVGRLTTEREKLYTCFSACCHLPDAGLWCAWAVGETGELRLGVLEPAGDQAEIRRRFSGRLTAPLGRLRRGELRPAGGGTLPDAWQSAPEPERLFRTPGLRQQLHGCRGGLTGTGEGRRFLALPCRRDAPFPLPGLFCFAQVRRIQGEDYAVFAFDETEWPVFP